MTLCVVSGTIDQAEAKRWKGGQMAVFVQKPSKKFSYRVKFRVPAGTTFEHTPSMMTLKAKRGLNGISCTVMYMTQGIAGATMDAALHDGFSTIDDEKYTQQGPGLGQAVWAEYNDPKYGVQGYNYFITQPDLRYKGKFYGFQLSSACISHEVALEAIKTTRLKRLR